MENKQPSRLRRWLKRSAFTLAVLITLLAAVVVFENWRGHRAWQKYRAEQEAKGEVFDWRQLLPAPVPDEQNFIKTPFLAPLTERDFEAQQRLSSTFLWQAGLSGRGDWRKAELTDWATLQLQLRSQTNSQQPEVQTFLQRNPAKPHEDVLFLFSQYETRMDELRKAAKRPYSSFNSRYDEGFDELLVIRLSAVKNLVMAFTLKSRAELAAGNSDNALEDWLVAVALEYSLDSEPVLITLLVKLAVVENLLNPIWEGLALGRWNEEQLILLHRTLQSHSPVGDAKRFFEGERAVMGVVLDQMLLSKTVRPQRPAGIFRSLLLPAWVAQNKISIGRIYSDYMLPMLDPENATVHVAELAATERKAMVYLEGSNPYRTRAMRVVPATAISKTILKVGHAQTSVNLAIVAVALERHRLAHGRHPEALNALLPAYLEAIPLDLDRQPLRYQLQPDGSFILYSIGVDLKDDNGRIGKPDGRFSTEEGDWVWKYPEAADR
jgi:hypothetical protein